MRSGTGSSISAGRVLPQRTFVLLAAGIVLLALLLRAWFVLVTDIEAPIRGDVSEYVAYAWNILEHQIFSMQEIGSSAATPDAYRTPGYPLFLALTMYLGDQSGSWYSIALHAQILLGTATVALTIALGRQWMSPPASLSAGLLTALWPHHIAATGALLTEVLFGFLIVLGLLFAALADKGRRPMHFAATGGAVFSLAWLVNPVFLFFPLLPSAIWLAKNKRRLALAMVLFPLVVFSGWTLRNAGLENDGPSVDRSVINFVQGSWPQYHAAHATAHRNSTSRQIMAAIRAEVEVLKADPESGWLVIGQRFAEAPLYYAKWYFLEKPWLLWDWDIRIGVGDVYFHRVRNSPLERVPLIAIKRLLHFLNPALFALSAAASIVLLMRAAGPGAHRSQFPAVLVAGFAVYVTAVHWVFQAEPRYSIAYRPEQMMLAVTALSWLSTHLGSFRRPDLPSPAGTT